ncbi:MAG: pyruvate:ferredoxin (flavodoxin) oxidoreductase [Treponema sp.]|nr:pyruvate:ferredoxin (flavodoxin) oxidoreductase [Treponema sp.]
MNRKKITMDGNEAAAYVAYAFSEFSGIYPITPSSAMADLIDQWSNQNKKNIFNTVPKLIEMQSEAGAAGVVHGALSAGSLATTFTASQGLLLMIPNMYKIAGEQLPAVFYVSARTIATHALSIFGDQSDIYACRPTGFSMLCFSNPQEIMDLAPVGHLAALDSKVPFINFFDGFRTSHEIQKVETWEYDSLRNLINQKALQEFKTKALNPNHPVMQGSHENPDIYFQHREACNCAYNNVPKIVKKYMKKINCELGTDYDLFNYYGSPDAERIIIAMGSVCNVIEETIDYLLKQGEKVGLVKVRLYRPWYGQGLLDVIPKTVKKIAVLDKTKEVGALGDPLFVDVLSTLKQSQMKDCLIIGGRFGLSSKDTTSAQILAVYDELNKSNPKQRFTIGITDDVTNLSLDEKKYLVHTCPSEIYECKFWGIGGDGTVGANKDSIKIIGDYTENNVQGYFQYDSKKTNGITISHLRFGKVPIKSSYYVKKADFVACHSQSYVLNKFNIIKEIKKDGILLLNTSWTDEELFEHIGQEDKNYLIQNNITVYKIDAVKIAQELKLGKYVNTILQSAFFYLTKIIPIEKAVALIKEKIIQKFSSKGIDVVNKNCNAVDLGIKNISKVKMELIQIQNETTNENQKPLYDRINFIEKLSLMEGDEIPVSAFMKNIDGRFELGGSAYEKRGIAEFVPEWDKNKCIQCTMCSLVCSHATIRPFLLSNEEVQNVPMNTKLISAKNQKLKNYQFTISVSPLDCSGCGVCVETCPVGAIQMVPQESQRDMQNVFDYLRKNINKKLETSELPELMSSQFNQPLLEFSGACGGCAETVYAKLITQLYGEQMYIANATGCSSIWGGPGGVSPYTVNNISKKGPAWANSLFEDNAEFGLGIYLGQKYIRDNLIKKLEMLLKNTSSEQLKKAILDFITSKDKTKENIIPTENLIKELENDSSELADEILLQKDYLQKKSVWIFGGDGWAYDIGFGGLDHVLASKHNVNVFVFDTEMYSNTGGQSSKASNIGGVGQFSVSGKDVSKKNLAEMMMTYGYVYVAQVALGANPVHTIKVIKEAESYNGPSLIIAYSPCELHGIKGGMSQCQKVMKNAVKSGYWNLFSFNPELKAQGKNPFTLSSSIGDGSYRDFLSNETRYSKLLFENLQRGEYLFKKSENISKANFERLMRLVDLYK